jgi:hypothetical protein
MRGGAGFGDRSEQPAVITRDDEQAVAVACATDDDRADSARGEADDHWGWNASWRT